MMPLCWLGLWLYHSLLQLWIDIGVSSYERNLNSIIYSWPVMIFAVDLSGNNGCNEDDAVSVVNLDQHLGDFPMIVFD